jgi:hypothetical protein
MKKNQPTLNTTMSVLSEDELKLVSGADRGDAAVAGMIAGGTAGWHAIKGAIWGARIGAFGGPVGGAVGAGVGAGVYQIFK